VVAGIGLATLALHAVIVSAERAIFLNGLDFTAAGVHVTGDPRDLTRLQVDLGAYGVATVVLFGLYVWILVLAFRGRLAGRSRIAALVFPVAFHLALLPGRPYLSLDLFTYLAQGAQVVVLGSNPYATPAVELAATDYGRELVSLGWRPTIPVTPYGPLWTLIEVGVVALTRDVGSGVLLMKAIAVGASLGSAAFIWAILGRLRPSAQLTGTLAYLWNPLVVGELAGEGHNDAVMILLVLAALHAAVRVRSTSTVVMLGLAVAAKFLPVIFAPPIAALLWRQSARRASHVRGAVTGLAAAVVISALLFAPFWVGRETFAGIAAGAETGAAFASTRWALLELAGPAADVPAQIFVALILVAAAIVVSARVRDPSDMLRACAWIALAYVLVASPYYWPWHATLPVALMALSPRGPFLWTIVALAAGSRLAAPLDDMFVNGFISLRSAAALTYVLGIGLPLLLVCATALLATREAGSPLPPVPISRG
jgi:alpha-1,6-mannosyltransferase